jgi:hypothetical protein
VRKSKYMLLSIALSTLVSISACGIDTPLPTRCRDVGVHVVDGDVISGTILQENVVEDTPAGRALVAQECWPLKNKIGCSIPVGYSSYVIWYIDHPAVRDHERCHALYEQPRHIKK